MRREYDSLVKALEAFQDAERAASALGPVSNLIPAQAIDDLRALQAELDQLAPPKDALTAFQAIELKLLDIERAAASIGIPQAANAAREQAQAAMEQITNEAMGEAAKSLSELSAILDKMWKETIQRAANAGKMIGDALTGDISGTLSALIPRLGARLGTALGEIAGDGIMSKFAAALPLIGVALGGMVKGFEDLGTNGAKATSSAIVGQIQTIIKGLTNIPELLVQLVPDLLTKALPDLIVALVGLIPRLAVALVIELRVAIVRGVVGWWREIGGFRGIVTSIADGVRTWWRETWDRVREWLRDIFTPGDQGRGRRVSDARAQELRDMQAAAMALTDPRGRPGQPTDPRTGRSRTTGSPQPAGPTLVIQAASLHPDVVPATLRDLDRMTRPGGLRRGTTGLGGT
jgi:CheY-specific phosphatase CheX